MKNKTEPTVSIFGEDINEGQCGAHADENAGWGLFLIFVGILLLLNTLGIIPWTVWDQIWKYWPMLIILAGLKTILGRNLVATVVMTIVNFVLFGTLLGYILGQYAPQLTRWIPEGVKSYFNYWRLIN